MIKSTQMPGLFDYENRMEELKTKALRLSDEQTEIWVMDRLSFQKFVDFWSHLK